MYLIVRNRLFCGQERVGRVVKVIDISSASADNPIQVNFEGIDEITSQTDILGLEDDLDEAKRIAEEVVEAYSKAGKPCPVKFPSN